MQNQKAPQLNIAMLGRPVITGEDGRPRPVAGHQPWAILGRLLLSERPLARRTIASEMFPDVDDPLGALRWCLAALRRATGPDTLRGDPIDLNFPADTHVDVWKLDDQDVAPPDTLEFLHGIEPSASSEFSTWLLIERERLASRVQQKLRRSVMASLSRQDFDGAIRMAEHLISARPLDESGHVLLVKSLAMSGMIATAIAHVEATERKFLLELGEPPTAALRNAARKTVADAPEGVSRGAVIDSLIKSGLAAVAAGAAGAGLDCLRRAVADAERLEDRYQTSRALQELGSALVHAVRGYDDEGAIFLRQAFDVAAEIGASDIAANALRELGYVEALAGRRPSAAQYLDEAMIYAQSDDDALAGICGVAGFNFVDWGKHQEGLSQFEHSLALSRKTGNRRRQVWSLGIGAWGQLRSGDHATAEEWSRSAITMCEELNWLAFLPWPQALLAEVNLDGHKASNSLEGSLEQTLAVSRQIGDPCWEAATARVLSLMHARAGDHERAERWTRYAQQSCCSVTDLYAGLLVEIISDKVKFFASSGQTERAQEAARELLALAAQTHADQQLQFAVSVVNKPC
jgi:DNA-binding SARP family transcriptional activator